MPRLPLTPSPPPFRPPRHFHRRGSVYKYYAAVLGLLALLGVHYFLMPAAFAPKYPHTKYFPAVFAAAGKRARQGQVSVQVGEVEEYAGSNLKFTLKEEKNNVKIDDRGLMGWELGQDGDHPIAQLIDRGKKLAEEMERKIAAVRSAEDAGRDYINEFHLPPPRGFESWYNFTKRGTGPHPPPLPSLIPLAHTPILPFLSHPAAVLRDRVVKARESAVGTWTLTFVPDGEGDEGTACTEEEKWEPQDWYKRGKGMMEVRGDMAWSWRCNNTLSLLLPILPLLPAQLFTQNPPLEMAFTNHDGPGGMVHDTFREKSEMLAVQGQLWNVTELQKAEKDMRGTHGWPWACPEGSPLKDLTNGVGLDGLGSVSRGDRTFIGDFEKSADYCANPDLMSLHHILIRSRLRGAQELVPTVSQCRTKWNSDIVGVPLDGVYEKVLETAWEDKDIRKIFWRGRATGIFHEKAVPWRSSQRERLHTFAANVSGTVPLLLPNGTVQDWGKEDLTERWLDIGLVGGPILCSAEDGSCDDMAREIDFKGVVKKEDIHKYRYSIDVDGNGWSSRFRRLLSGNTVVLKSTVYPEWFHTMLIPWYHYVPVKLDYSDVFDIVSFFEGSPDGSVAGNDHLAKSIAANALQFTQEKWRPEDMQSFMYLLILEYWRMMSDDRGLGSFNGKMF
ncbi:hypothetical protein IAT38_000151 [Cryptococcus sp. DSM 104549]